MVQPSNMAQILKFAFVFAECTVQILKGAPTNLARHFLRFFDNSDKFRRAGILWSTVSSNCLHSYYYYYYYYYYRFCCSCCYQKFRLNYSSVIEIGWWRRKCSAWTSPEDRVRQRARGMCLVWKVRSRNWTSTDAKQELQPGKDPRPS